ncbi:MAG: recombinase family protein [Oscillospiraceae bacterium]|jgi:DNA invertase Pin-like site-specific DNA recombinase|nr:recombinase family protein [Oscillospiraceae bacterium]
MLIGYARASLDKQPLDRQVDELTAYGVDPRNIYQEKAHSTDPERSELKRMLDELQPADTVIFVELSRLGRSLIDLVNIVGVIEKKGATFKSLKENLLDTTTSEGKFLFGIFAILAEFERNRLSDRTKSGLKAAAARGRKGGRPSKPHPQTEAILALYHAGNTPTPIYRALGEAVSIATIKRVIKAAEGGTGDGER